ncbi:MAG TPA: response regulator [Thiobacillus sp.]|nr:response regulator [Thiobacillus sp.]
MTCSLLIAENDVAQAKLLARMVIEAGFETVVVHDGNAALVELRTSPPDVLFTDLLQLLYWHTARTARITGQGSWWAGGPKPEISASRLLIRMLLVFSGTHHV